MFGIPVTAFSHATTARAQYKWRNVIKAGNSHTRAATAHVNINLLKGALLLSKRHWINETAQAKMVSVIQTTHVTNKGPQKLMPIQMREFFNVPLIASSYGGVDLGFKSHMKEALDRTHDPWVTRCAALPLHHRGTLSQYFNLLNI